MEPKSIHSESELLQRVAQGDEQAFRRIYDLYSNRLFNYVLKITGREEVAEEIVMDAFMKIWVNREYLTEVNRFDSYLYTIVRNQAFNALKRIAHEARIIKEISRDVLEYQEFTEETVVYNDYRNLLHEAVNQLPPQQKRVYTLSRDEGLKYEEIAEKLNLSKNTVKSHLKKAVSSLRTAFSNYLFLFFWVLMPY